MFKNKENYGKIEEGDLPAVENLPPQVDKGEVILRFVNKNMELKTLLRLSDSD